MPAVPRSLARIAVALFLIGVAGLVIWSRAGRFVMDPAVLPPSPDTPWYIWRSQFLTAYSPEELVAWSGPSGQGGGGYRVATPLLGALILQTTGIAAHTLSTVFVAGLGALLALALGAAAYGYRRDPLLFGCVALFASALLFANPFLGYTDNVLALLLIAGALSVLDSGARGAAAVGVSTFLAFLTHPPVAAGFALAVLAAVGLGRAFSRARKGGGSDGPLIAAVVVGVAVGVMAWYVGAWGARASFGDGIDPANNSKQEFVARLLDWLGQLKPWITVPLLLVGIVAIALDRRRLVHGRSPAVMALWVLPVLAAAGAVTSLIFPYHRFLNVTASHVLLAGIGLFVLITSLRWIVRAPQARVPALLAGVVIGAAILMPLWASGLRLWNSHGGGWLGYLRPPTAAIEAYFQNVMDPPPVVFIAADQRTRPWNYRRGTSNRVRAALPATLVQEAYVFVGEVRDFLARRATGTPRLHRVSRAALLDTSRALGKRRPLVLLMRQWNQTPQNRRFLGPPHAVAMDRDLFILRAQGLVQPNEEARAVAYRAGETERAHLNSGRFVMGGIAGISRRVAAITLIVLLPGLMALRWFGRLNLAFALGAAPPLSLGMNLVVGFVVLAVFRRPVTQVMAWTIVTLAMALGAAGWWLGRRRTLNRSSVTESPNATR